MVKKHKSNARKEYSKSHGTITDIISTETYPIVWAGTWSEGYECYTKGVSLPLYSLPPMSFKINKVYRVVFEYEDARWESVDKLVIFDGIECLIFGKDDKPVHILRFKEISNFEVMQYVEKERSRYD